MGAPNVVRGGSHSGNVSALALATEGELDILSSDYVPAALLMAAFRLTEVEKVGGLPGANRLVTKNPALAVGLADRGEIAPESAPICCAWRCMTASRWCARCGAKDVVSRERARRLHRHRRPQRRGQGSPIRAVAERLPASELFVARRVITRPSDATEEHDTLDDERFDAERQAGRFALSWDAHGLKYGIPVAVDDAVAGGQDRRLQPFARRRYFCAPAFKRCWVVEVTASDKILCARLAARGRESAEARAGRIARAHSAEVDVSPDATIHNDGALEDAVEAFAALVRHWREPSEA